MSQENRRPSSAIILAALAVLGAGGGFAYLLKLMHDMTGHMGLMSTQIVAMAGDIRRMQGDMAQLARNVADISQQVRTLPQMGQDMQRMREGLEGISSMATPAEGMDRMNPMGVIRQMMPGSGH